MLSYDKVIRTADMQCVDSGSGILHRPVLDRVPCGRPHDIARLYQGLLLDGELAGYEVVDQYCEVSSPWGLANTDKFLGQHDLPQSQNYSFHRVSHPRNQLGTSGRLYDG